MYETKSGQPAGGHCPAAGWVIPAGHQASDTPHYTCSSLCWGNSFCLSKNRWNVLSALVLPSSYSLFPALHSRIPPGSSVLIFCSPHTSPLFPPQTPPAVRRCCCLPKILLSLPYPLAITPGCSLLLTKAESLVRGRKEGSACHRLQGGWKAPMPPKVLTTSVKQSNASALLLLMALQRSLQKTVRWKMSFVSVRMSPGIQTPALSSFLWSHSCGLASRMAPFSCL